LIVPEFHVFAIRARDNQLEASPVVSLALRVGDLPPSVRFISPQPSAFLDALVPRGSLASWWATIRMGYPTHRPDYYRVRAVLAGDPGFDGFMAPPDSLLAQGERSGWAGWTRYGGDSTSVAFSDLPLAARGLIAVVAFDDQGARSEHLSLDGDALRFAVDGTSPGRTSRARCSTSTSAGGIARGPESLPEVEFPMNVSMELRWDSSPIQGSRIVSTRWMLDPAGGPTDTTTRWILPMFIIGANESARCRRPC